MRKILGIDIKMTVKEWWRFAENHLILVSANDVGAYWYKYERYEESYNNGEFYRMDDAKLLLGNNWNIMLWQALRSGCLKYSKDMEEYAKNNMF